MKTSRTIFAVALLVSALWGASVSGEVLRVLSCEMPAGRDAVSNIFAAIKAEAPDIILLQGARGWAAGASLARSFKPAEYYVLTSSSFGTPDTVRNPKELAILSKHKGYYAWTQRSGTNWPPTGFAFAAISVGKQKFGLFSTQIGRGTQAVTVAESVIEHLELVKGWRVNRPSSFLVMSSTKLTPLKPHAEVRKILSTNGFALAEGAKADHMVYAYPPGSARLVEIGLTTFPMLIAEFDPAAPPALVAAPASPGGTKASANAQAKKDRTAPPGASPTGTNSPLPVGTSTARSNPVNRAGETLASNAAPAVIKTIPPEKRSTAGKEQPTWPLRWPFIALGSAVLLIFGALVGSRLWRKPARRQKLIPDHFGSEEGPYVVVAPRSTTWSGNEPGPTFSGRIVQGEGADKTSAAVLRPAHPADPAEMASKAGLIEWLKREFVRRLVRDRSALLDQQTEAATKARDASERLATLEERIRQQNEGYIRRIEELTRELGAAREENRELIRLRIAQVRADMEAARARLMEEG